MRRALLAGVAALAIALTIAHGASAARKDRKLDVLWTHPDYAGLGVDRIALIPPATYDHNLQTENLVESAIGQAFRGTGYRWISGTMARDLLRSRTGGDSVLAALKDGILKQARADSLATPRVCAMLGCDALLSVRVDLWEQLTPEWNQSGKPTTTVQLKAALVDSLGRLLWSAAGSQTAEGPYYDPRTNPIAVKETGLDRTPVTAQGGAPSFRETLTTLLARWTPAFPAKPAPAGAAGADSAAGAKPR